MSDTTNPKDLLGMKKPPLRLVPPALILFVSKVMALGAKKYGPYNWRDKKVRHTVYIEAAMRHLLALQDGQNLDPESGEPHEAHVSACMGIILDARACGCLIDDRALPGKAAEIIASMTETSIPLPPAATPTLPPAATPTLPPAATPTGSEFCDCPDCCAARALS